MPTHKQFKQAPKNDDSSPTPITLVRLRDHFSTKYKLTEKQVEIMIVSSSKSLEQGLAHLQDELGKEAPDERLGAIYHGFKGLFLNMGEEDWAAFTKEIEEKILAGEQSDHKKNLRTLHQGVVEILSYCGTSDAGHER